MLSLFSLPLLAQQTATPDAPAQATTPTTPAQTQTTTRMGRNRPMPRMAQHQMGDPATRARKMTDRMTQQLGLDQATSQKLYDATLARAQKVEAIQASSDDNRAKAQALKANADDYKSKLQSILTPDQFAKVQAMKGKMRHGRGGSDAMQDGSDQK